MQVGLEALGPEGKAVELTCSIGKLKGARGHVGLGAGSCPPESPGPLEPLAPRTVLAQLP